MLFVLVLIIIAPYCFIYHLGTNALSFIIEFPLKEGKGRVQVDKFTYLYSSNSVHLDFDRFSPFLPHALQPGNALPLTLDQLSFPLFLTVIIVKSEPTALAGALVQ